LALGPGHGALVRFQGGLVCTGSEALVASVATGPSERDAFASGLDDWGMQAEGAAVVILFLSLVFRFSFFVFYYYIVFVVRETLHFLIL
jgi:hypothetical protein